MMMMNNVAAAAVPAAEAAALEQNPSTVANPQEVAAGPSNPLVGLPNPRKKRTKLSRIENPFAAVAKTIVKRKPDPAAPKITRPCTECGKKFWSWKALFGHMRCHPERQWRGINPPPNLRNRPQEEEGIRNSSMDAAAGGSGSGRRSIMTEEDHEAAACLLMLANSPMPGPSPAAAYFCSSRIPMINIGEDDSGEGRAANVGVLDGGNIDGDHNCRFECSCCRKVFTSHQALGGHRASHRNVKGCFAITTSSSKNDGEPEGEFNDEFDGAILMELTRTGGDNQNSLIGEYSHHHKCGICSRVFTSGQALGGHKRCHWEKTMNNESLTPSSPSTSSAAPPPLTPLPSIFHQHPAGDGGVDLNSPSATLESSSRVCLDCHHHDFLSAPNSHHSLSSSTSLGLDLKLGL